MAHIKRPMIMNELGGNKSKLLPIYHPPFEISGSISKPNKVPEPKSSLIVATAINKMLYQRPLPRPSKKLNRGFSFIAKASALPITIQLVMINPTNTDNFLLVS